MARYELIAHNRAGQPHGRPVFVTADSPGEAVMLGGPTLRRVTERDDTHAELYAVYRHRRVRGRRLVGAFRPTDRTTAWPACASRGARCPPRRACARRPSSRHTRTSEAGTPAAARTQ